MSPETLTKEMIVHQASQEISSELGAVALQLTAEQTTGQEYELQDKRIIRLTPIYSPAEVLESVPLSEKSAETVNSSREKIIKIMRPQPADDRLVVVLGPCSVHDARAGLEYADWVGEQRRAFGGDLELIMRAYLEKPRTTVGWKGLINDPHLDGSFAINEGLVAARELLSDITSRGVPVASELLDTSTPQYLSDLVSYGAIGARTTESQLHRELASGISFSIGFKNGTGGSIQIAIDAIKSAAVPHNFIGIDKDGHSAIVETSGNKDCNIILRGSSHGPNYTADHITAVHQKLQESGVSPTIMVDVSHANSNKDYLAQPVVSKNVAKQIAQGNVNIRGVMIESNLVEGSQKLTKKEDLVYGQSITDACVGLSDTRMMLQDLAHSVQVRRRL